LPWVLLVRAGVHAFTGIEHVFDTVIRTNPVDQPPDAAVESHRQDPGTSSTWDALAVPDRDEMGRDRGYIEWAEEYVSAFVKERGSAMSSSTSHEEDGPPGQVCSACLR
jgi:hypothetical protein